MFYVAGSDAFVKVIRSRRKNLGWSQKELAKKAGLSVQMINFMENRYRLPSEETTRKLAKALDLDEEMLLVLCGELQVLQVANQYGLKKMEGI